MSSKKKVLRFVVTGALLGAPLVTGCGADEDININEPAPQPTINEAVEQPPEEETVNEPYEDPLEEAEGSGGIDPEESEPAEGNDEPAPE